MAHLQKFTKTDIGNVSHELTRDKNADGSYTFHQTGYIDSSRTHLNYSMSDVNVAKGVKDRINNVFTEYPPKRKPRKDLVAACGWTVTCPEELKQNPKPFFDTVYKFVQDRYGKENVINGFVHLDETSPHIHIYVVPVVKEQATGRYKICAKEFATRAEMSGFHTDLDKVIADEFGQAGLIRNGRTKGNYTTEELKERTQEETRLRNWDKSLSIREADLSRSKREFNAEVISEYQRIEKARQRGLNEALNVIEKRLADKPRNLPPVSNADAELIAYLKSIRLKSTGEVVYDHFLRDCKKYKEGKRAEKETKAKAEAKKVIEQAVPPVQKPVPKPAISNRERDKLLFAQELNEMERRQRQEDNQFSY